MGKNDFPTLNDTAQLLAAMTALGEATKTPRKVYIHALGWIYVRELTIGDVDAQLADDKAVAENPNAKTIRWGAARSATRLLCNQAGQRLLDPENPEHIAKMAELPLRVLTKINATQEEIDKGN